MLSGADKKAFKDQKELQALAKGIVTGQECEMTCHMVEVENNLGRSLVIDLGTKSPNKFRQVDHRSIDYIIF